MKKCWMFSLVLSIFMLITSSQVNNIGSNRNINNSDNTLLLNISTSIQKKNLNIINGVKK